MERRRCDKCGQSRKLENLRNEGTKQHPYMVCGSCRHREMRRQNTREMHGRGRRGY